MASDTECSIIAKILKETTRMLSEGRDIGTAISNLEIPYQISFGVTDININSLLHPDIVNPVKRTWLEIVMKVNLERPPVNIPTFQAQPTKIVFKPNGIKWEIVPEKLNLQKQLTLTLEDLPKKLPVPVDSNMLTKEQQRLLKQIRYETIRNRLIVSTSLSTGISIILNIPELFNNGTSDFAVHVAKDAGISFGMTIADITTDGIPILNEGAGVIFLGIIDAVKAVVNKDWKRFGLNLGLNTCATGGALAGAKFGFAVGTWFPGIGNAAGSAIGGIIGGLAARYGAGKTRLGDPTPTEIANKIKEEYNNQLKEVGLEVDPNSTYDELMEQSKTGNLKVIKTKDIVSSVSPEVIRQMIPEQHIEELLRLATRISPSDREKGLIMIYGVLKQTRT